MAIVMVMMMAMVMIMIWERGRRGPWRNWQSTRRPHCRTWPPNWNRWQSLKLSNASNSGDEGDDVADMMIWERARREPWRNWQSTMRPNCRTWPPNWNRWPSLEHQIPTSLDDDDHVDDDDDGGGDGMGVCEKRPLEALEKSKERVL